MVRWVALGGNRVASHTQESEKGLHQRRAFLCCTSSEQSRVLAQCVFRTILDYPPRMWSEGSCWAFPGPEESKQPQRPSSREVGLASGVMAKCLWKATLHFASVGLSFKLSHLYPISHHTERHPSFLSPLFSSLGVETARPWSALIRVHKLHTPVTGPAKSLLRCELLGTKFKALTSSADKWHFSMWPLRVAE